MLTPRYSCVCCGCEAAATDVMLVEAMGWTVLAETEGGTSLACVCPVCRRARAHQVDRLLDRAARRELCTSDAHARVIS